MGDAQEGTNCDLFQTASRQALEVAKEADLQHRKEARQARIQALEEYQAKACEVSELARQLITLMPSEEWSRLEIRWSSDKRPYQTIGYKVDLYYQGDVAYSYLDQGIRRSIEVLQDDPQKDYGHSTHDLGCLFTGITTVCDVLTTEIERYRSL